jgi:hypothetical protein
MAVAAGCNSGDKHAIHNAAAVSGAPNANPVLTKIANQPGARKNDVQTKCAAVPGGWGAEGTATNPGKKEVTEQFQAQKKMLCPMPGISVV